MNNKIIKIVYEFMLFLLICWGGHAWFTWSLDEFQVNVVSRLNSTYKSISCYKVLWQFNMTSSVGSTTKSYVNTLSVSTTHPGNASGKSIEWTQYQI